MNSGRLSDILDLHDYIIDGGLDWNQISVDTSKGTSCGGSFVLGDLQLACTESIEQLLRLTEHAGHVVVENFSLSK